MASKSCKRKPIKQIVYRSLSIPPSPTVTSGAFDATFDLYTQFGGRESWIGPEYILSDSTEVYRVEVKAWGDRDFGCPRDPFQVCILTPSSRGSGIDQQCIPFAGPSVFEVKFNIHQQRVGAKIIGSCFGRDALDVKIWVRTRTA